MTPVDLERCQAVPTGAPFQMGGEIGDPKNGYRVRCRTPPSWVATLLTGDGKRGSMSLCDSCKAAMLRQLGPHFASFAAVDDWRPE